jgi:hypothetical protein
VKRYESGNGGLGILSAIKIAKALKMPLPAVKLDARVERFTRNLLCDIPHASEDFDAVLHGAMKRGLLRRDGMKWKPLVKPKGFLGMISAPDDTLPPVRISIEGISPFLRLLDHANPDASDLVSSPMKIDSSGIMPVDLVALFGELTWCASEMKDSQDGKLPRFDRRPAAVWRHVLNARSENVGLLRLNEEVERFEQLREEHQINDLRLRIDFRRSILAAFVNYYDLSVEIHKLASEGNKIPENFGVYLNSYIRLLRLSEMTPSNSSRAFGFDSGNSI